MTGARVDRFIPREDGGVFLLARNAGKNFSLLLSPRRPLPLLHLVSMKPRAAGEPHPFLLHLKSRLVGTRIMRIGLVNKDRIAELDFARPSAAYRLFFELTGTSANMFLTDAESRILASYHPVSAAGSHTRTLLPGALYVPPVPQPERPREDSGLWSAFDASSPNRSAETLSRQFEEERQAAALRGELRSATREALKRAERRRAALSTDLRTVEQADQFRTMGDLVLANLQNLKTGITSAELEGYDGTRLTVPLDPSLSPPKNADRYFKKYKKARTGRPIISVRLRHTEEEIARLQALLIEIEKSADSDSLSRLRPEFSDTGRKGRNARSVKEKTKGAMPGIRTIMYQGWEIILGRSAAGNDHLTTRLARPDDLWLHAEGLPGSHVLVKNPSKGDIPPDVLVKAASLAALHSKGKTETKVPVAYTPARYVKKPKGAKPGLVVLSHRKTVVVKPEGGREE